jgi:hypothetical protein
MSYNTPENHGRQPPHAELVSESLKQTVKMQIMKSLESFKIPHFIHTFLNPLPIIICMHNSDRSTLIRERGGRRGSSRLGNASGT